MKNKNMWSTFTLHDFPFKYQNNNSRFEFSPIRVSFVLQRILKEYLDREFLLYGPVISWTKELKVLMGDWKLGKHYGFVYNDYGFFFY